MAAGDVLWDGGSGYEWAVVEVPTAASGIAKAPGIVLLNAAGVATTPLVGYTEDAASAADPIGPMMMGRRRDALTAAEVSATGDNIALNATSKGELHTRNLALEALLPTAIGTQLGAASLSVVPASDGFGVICKPATTGGLTAGRIVTGTTGFFKASAGQLYKITAYNANAAVRYLHLYNKASAPTLNTDTPIITIALLAASAREIDFSNIGAVFSTGIAWAYTTDDVAVPVTAGTSTELHATALYN